jgi:uncharacterized protein (TIGR02246 family)
VISLRRIGEFALAVALVVAATSVGRSEEAGTDSARAAIEQANTLFSEAIARGDAQAIAKLYTEDAILLPERGELVKGRQAIGEFWKTAMNGGVKSVTVTTLDVGGSGDLAHEVGTVLLTLQAEGRPPATASAKFVVVWKREADGWKIHRDIWNDPPPD